MKHRWISCRVISGFAVCLVFTSISLSGAFNETHTPVVLSETTPVVTLTTQMEPVRANFSRINAVDEWTKIAHMELEDTTEGGEALYYFQDDQLQKIVARHYGETFQQIIEYYLLDDSLSFVYEKTYRYNRPIYYDPADIEGSDDTEAFDFEKSDISECRSYFENGQLFHQILHPPKPLKNDLKAEKKRIEQAFEHLSSKLLPEAE